MNLINRDTAVIQGSWPVHFQLSQEAAKKLTNVEIIIVDGLAHEKSYVYLVSMEIKNIEFCQRFQVFNSFDPLTATRSQIINRNTENKHTNY